MEVRDRCVARVTCVAAFALTAAVSGIGALARADQVGGHSVLLLGGRGTLSASELTSGDYFDTATQSFTAVAGIAPDRRRYSATLLNDGRILIVGGFDPQGPSKQALILDRPGESLTSAPDTMCGHGFHSATLLKDGLVLIAGGSISDDASSDCAEIYDPTANRFQLTAGKLNVSRLRHSATLLRDGRVLIAGGAHASGGVNHALNSAEIFDPATGRFTLTRDRMHTKRDDLRSCLFHDGTVLIAGGWDNQAKMLHSLEIFNPASVTFKALKERIPIEVLQLVLLKDSRVLLAGDERVVIFDPVGQKLSTPAGRMHEARTVYSASALEDGRVLFAGGRGKNIDRVLDSAEIFDPANGTFTSSKNALSGPRMEHLGVSLSSPRPR